MLTLVLIISLANLALSGLHLVRRRELHARTDARLHAVLASHDRLHDGVQRAAYPHGPVK